jgi:hypothetical protein
MLRLARVVPENKIGLTVEVVKSNRVAPLGLVNTRLMPSLVKLKDLFPAMLVRVILCPVAKVDTAKLNPRTPVAENAGARITKSAAAANRQLVAADPVQVNKTVPANVAVPMVQLPKVRVMELPAQPLKVGPIPHVAAFAAESDKGAVKFRPSYRANDRRVESSSVISFSAYVPLFTPLDSSMDALTSPICCAISVASSELSFIFFAHPEVRPITMIVPNAKLKIDFIHLE